MKKELPEEIQLILNGHNKNVKQAEDLLAEPLMKMVKNCGGKEGEELAGTMNFWWMEIVGILRKAAAIGYNEALFDIKKKK